MYNNGMDKDIAAIKGCIEKILDSGITRIIIFPFGDVGNRVKQILNDSYGVKEWAIIDNHLSKYNKKIHPISVLKEIIKKSDGEIAVILATTNRIIHSELKAQLLKYVSNKQIYELPIDYVFLKTQIGKYSFGPICNDNIYIESIGSFCSFAAGVGVVGNHESKYISTYSFMGSLSTAFDDINMQCEEEYKVRGIDYPPFYFSGVEPVAEKVTKVKRTRIGNDVWLGRNVTITNGADIGNGVIAGAGAVITKDIPDYAIVGGVPAHIIKYRYNKEQIEALNEICWWDWSDELIRERFNDFYLPVDDFIRKYR